MTTATSSFVFRNSTSAQLRVWTAAVTSLLAASGLVQTSDTGQINTATVNWTNSAGVLHGYQIWRFNDTLQATAPIFLRFEYRSSASLATAPKVTLFAGPATDGAGNLTGVVSPELIGSQATVLPPATAISSYACHTDGTLALCLGRLYIPGGVTGNSILSLIIDRVRDATGTALTAGYAAEVGAPETVSTFSAHVNPTASSTLANGVPSLVPDMAAVTAAAGVDVQLFRHYAMTPAVRPLLGALTYINGDITALTPVSVTVLGTAHTYLPVGVGATSWSASNGISHVLAMRWE